MNPPSATAIEARIALTLGVLSYATASMQISESARLNANLTLLIAGIYATIIYEGSIVTTFVATGAVRGFLGLMRSAWGA